MIRYADALDGLETKIKNVSNHWLEKAAERTALFAVAGRYHEQTMDSITNKQRTLSPFWSEVKPIYMKLQHNKCIYCEKKLEGKEFATVEWDLEHFRPKGRVRSWPREGEDFGYDFATGDGAETGYFLLAYHPYNYAAACKTCNSPFKSDHFPVAAQRVSGQSNPQDYESEHPFLVYPLGHLDEDPTTLITFTGTKAIPYNSKDADLARWRRGRVMIDFFGLNRDGLTRDRAGWLAQVVWPAFLLAEKGEDIGNRNIERATSERGQFTNCTRCFLQLCSQDRNAAASMVPEFEAIIDAMEE